MVAVLTAVLTAVDTFGISDEPRMVNDAGVVGLNMDEIVFSDGAVENAVVCSTGFGNVIELSGGAINTGATGTGDGATTGTGAGATTGTGAGATGAGAGAGAISTGATTGAGATSMGAGAAATGIETIGGGTAKVVCVIPILVLSCVAMGASTGAGATATGATATGAGAASTGGGAAKALCVISILVSDVAKPSFTDRYDIYAINRTNINTIPQIYIFVEAARDVIIYD